MAQPDRIFHVRLLIFSGRPDPEFTLDPVSAEQLETLFRSTLKGKSAEGQPFETLGYRGFLIRMPPTSTELPSEVRVYRGTVSGRIGSRVLQWLDTAGIEEFLLSQARKKDLGEILDASRASASGLR